MTSDEENSVPKPKKLKHKEKKSRPPKKKTMDEEAGEENDEKPADENQKRKPTTLTLDGRKDEEINDVDAVTDDNPNSPVKRSPDVKKQKKKKKSPSRKRPTVDTATEEEEQPPKKMKKEKKTKHHVEHHKTDDQELDDKKKHQDAQKARKKGKQVRTKRLGVSKLPTKTKTTDEDVETKDETKEKGLIKPKGKLPTLKYEKNETKEPQFYKRFDRDESCCDNNEKNWHREADFNGLQPRNPNANRYKALIKEKCPEMLIELLGAEACTFNEAIDELEGNAAKPTKSTPVHLDKKKNKKRDLKAKSVEQKAEAGNDEDDEVNSVEPEKKLSGDVGPSPAFKKTQELTKEKAEESSNNDDESE
ncbi:hypothetical protein M3Y95_00370200 [Aphelenchoides besseyi]|nr:hypothetical protein M3Y95_00370200 [Aphelenchoides besseyi]